MQDKHLFELCEIRRAIERMDARMSHGLRRLAMVPVACICCGGLFYLLWSHIITEWVWASFMLVILFSYFGEGIRYLFDKVPFARVGRDSTMKITFLLLILYILFGTYFL